MDLNIRPTDEWLAEFRSYVDVYDRPDRDMIIDAALAERMAGTDTAALVNYYANLAVAGVVYAAALVAERSDPTAPRMSYRDESQAVTVNVAPDRPPRNVRKTVIRDDEGKIVAVDEQEVDA